VQDTRTRLIEAGERLFAERGIDAVSLREISRASGARNAVALQHHFGGRAGLLGAILAKHGDRVETRRHVLLDQYEAAGARDARPLAGALVRPLAACLSDPDGGGAFLRIYSDLVNRPRPAGLPGPAESAPDRAGAVSGDSMERWRTLVEPLMPPSATRVHRRFSALLYVTVELARCARLERPEDSAVITGQVIDVACAILTAPVSGETRHLIAEHDARRAREPTSAPVRRRSTSPSRPGG
jgi:AcrR family transcriptional regulator